MEPYLVKCASCQSKIRIRNPKLIGKKVPCPKCNADITVTPPAPQKIHVAPSDLPSVDSTALTKEGFAADDLSGLGEGTAPPLGAFDNFDFSEVDQALLHQQAQAEQTMQYYSAPDSDSAPNSDSWSAPERAAPNDQWASKSAARSRQMLIVGFLGASSCIVAAIGFFIFLRWYKSSPTLAQQPVVNGQPANDKVPDSQSTNEQPAPVDNQQPETNGQSNAANSASDSSSPSEANPPSQLPIVDVVNPTATEKVEDSVKTPSVSEQNPNAGAAQPKDAQSEMPPRLKELMNAIVDPVISEPAKILIPESPKVTELEIQTGNRELKMTPVSKLNEQASQRNIWSLNITQRKLHDVVSIWNSTVGLPVEVSILSLAAADYDMNQLFDLEIKNVSASAGIEQLAAAVGLKVESRENRFWLLYAAVPDQDKLPTQVKIDDLVTGEDQRKWLAETIELVFPGTSPTLSLEGGFLSCKADQLDRLTWFSMVRMLENWRSELALPSQLTNYRKQNLSVPFVTASKLSSLDSMLNQVNSTAKPLSQLVNQQFNSAKIRCLVDWPALEFLPVRLAGGETKSIFPQTPRLSVTFNRPLRSLLHELEFELGMVTMLIDENTAIMTSRFAYRRMPQVFVMPSQRKSVDAYWSQYFRPLTPIDNEGISNVIIRPTPDGKLLIVKCCWPTYQFE